MAHSQDKTGYFHLNQDPYNKALEMSLKKRTQELKKKDIDLETLTENIPGGVVKVLLDPELTIQYCNDGYLNLLGYTKSELEEEFNNKALLLIHPDDRKIVQEKIHNYLKNNDTVEIGHRLVKKDGSFIWVLLSGRCVRMEFHDPVFFFVLIDYTKEKLAEQKLRISEQRYRIVSEQSDNVIFEYNIKNDNILLSQSWEKSFGYQPFLENFLSSTMEKEVVHKEDAKIFRDLFISLIHGKNYGKRDLRIRKSDGSFVWCRVRASLIRNEVGMPFKIIGKFINIDSEKKEKDRLKSRAQIDALTGLYNKMTAQRMIETVLSNSSKEEKHALYIIDIDNFKCVNDDLGHLYGDAVLTNVSNQIGKLFRTTDIAGRIGGDEFVVLMKEAYSEEIIRMKAEEIIKLFNRTNTGGHPDYKISGSIGIAIYPKDGITYKELFKKADKALYYSKNQGKDRFQFFGASMEKNYKTTLPGSVNVNNLNHKFSHEHIWGNIFQMIYNTRDINKAVSVILEFVGRIFEVNHVYVFENSMDERYWNNTFEWCNNGIQPNMDSMQKISRLHFGDYQSLFDEDGIFYCKDVGKLPKRLQQLLNSKGIKSILQAAIVTDGKFRGFVGFADSNEYRLWTKDEIDTLHFISRILSTYLIKKRIQDELAKSFNITKTMLDNLDSMLYVINPQNYELLFMNQKTLKFAPDANVGDLCYRALWGERSKPCENCPIKGLDESHKACKMEVYHTDYKFWMYATASKITWSDASPVCLINCNDITKYKTKEI